MLANLENKHLYRADVRLPFVNRDGSEDANKSFRKGELFVVLYRGSDDPLFGHSYYGKATQLDINTLEYAEILKCWWYDLDYQFYIGGK